MATTTKTRRSRKATNPGTTPDQATGQDTATLTDNPKATPDTTGGTPDAPDATPDSADAPTSAPPAPVPTSAPPATNTDHLKVVIVAGVLGDQPDDGLTGADVVERSGLQPGLVARILAAMEVADVARRLPPDQDGTERWVRGEGQLDAVDVANAPTHRTCPTCGHTRRISVNVGARRNGGSADPGFNSDGQRKLRKNELRTMVRAFILDRPGHMFAAGDLAREIGLQEGRTISSGAVQNNLDTLLTDGAISHANPDDPHDRRVTAPATEPAGATA